MCRQTLCSLALFELLGNEKHQVVPGEFCMKNDNHLFWLEMGGMRATSMRRFRHLSKGGSDGGVRPASWWCPQHSGNSFIPSEGLCSGTGKQMPALGVSENV